jgi:hypothetical protein
MGRIPAARHVHAIIVFTHACTYTYLHHLYHFRHDNYIGISQSVHKDGRE